MQQYCIMATQSMNRYRTMEQMQVPNYISEAIGEMFELIEEKTDSEFEVTGNTQEIAHEAYSGFMPFTNGGVQFTAPIFLNDLTSSGKGFMNSDVNASIEKTVDYCYTSARESFIVDNRKALEEHFSKEQLDSNSDEINYHTLYELKQGTLAEELSDMETGWLEGILFVEHRVQFYSADNHRNDTGEDEICFLSGVNLDYDYGRDKGLEYTFEQTIKVGDLTPNVIKDITKQMLQSI